MCRALRTWIRCTANNRPRCREKTRRRWLSYRRSFLWKQYVCVVCVLCACVCVYVCMTVSVYMKLTLHAYTHACTCSVLSPHTAKPRDQQCSTVSSVDVGSSLTFELISPTTSPRQPCMKDWQLNCSITYKQNMNSSVHGYQAPHGHHVLLQDYCI